MQTPSFSPEEFSSEKAAAPLHEAANQKDVPQEIELKYQLAEPGADDVAGQLCQQPWLASPNFVLGTATSGATLDIYLDTPYFTLLRAGFGLRLRRAKETWLVTLKSMAPVQSEALFSRAELERPLGEESEIVAHLRQSLKEQSEEQSGQQTSLTMGQLLAPIRDMPFPAQWDRLTLPAGIQTDELPLRPVVIVAQERTKRLLAYRPEKSSDEPIETGFAELSLDHVALHAPHQASALLVRHHDGSPTPRPLARYWEVEIELTAPGQAHLMQQLADELAADKTLTAAAPNKEMAGLRVIVTQPLKPSAPESWITGEKEGEKEGGKESETRPAGITRTMSMGDAGRQIWRQFLLELLYHESGVSQHQSIKSVHDMRVTLRRMRAADRIFGLYFEPDEVASFRQIMRKTAKRLGKIRDLDVALLALNEVVELGQIQRDEGINKMFSIWEEERQKGHLQARRWLTDHYYNEFLTDMLAFCHHWEGLPQAQAKPVPVQVAYVMPSKIWLAYGHVRAYRGRIHVEAPLTDFHALRIQCKRFRYSLEFVSHLLTQPEGGGLLTLLKSVQDNLGRIQDAVVVKTNLGQLRQQGVESPGLDSYWAMQDSIIEQERAIFLQLWQELNSVAFRRLLGEALSNL